MHIHILGICGTFMGSLALLARDMGFTVTGSDQNVYPPMSTQLAQAGIRLHTGYDADQLDPAPDLVVVGNAMKRGIPVVEALLDAGLPYTSGPEFLARYILPGKHVLAVAGTHGKTTTTTMLAWILDQAGLNPGFLIGGVPQGFSQSARLGGDYFVVEADEYDSAFFDKRSKFVHYRPRTAILNNLEFDHADIFEDLAAIQKQFHHLVRTVPGQGLIVMPAATPALEDTLAQGCWTPVTRFSPAAINDATWQYQLHQPDGSDFTVLYRGEPAGHVRWNMTGLHNVSNALAAIAAARHAGVEPAVAATALSQFGGIKRRMELVGEAQGVRVFDDFAHHPTAIKTTLDGARKKFGSSGKIWAVIEPRSNTMRMGTHKADLAPSIEDADEVIWYQPEGLDWDLQPVINTSARASSIMHSIDGIVADVASRAQPGDTVIIMSNGGFGGIHPKMLAALQARA